MTKQWVTDNKSTKKVKWIHKMIKVVYKKEEKKDCCDFVMLSRAQDDGPQFNQRPQEN